KEPPRVFVETAIKQTRGAIGYYETGIFALAEETPQFSNLKKATAPVIQSLKEHLQFLQQELLPRAKGDWRLGKEKFAKKLDLKLTTGIPAEEVLQEAEAEMDRVTAEMYVITRQLWSRYFPTQPLPPDDAAGRRGAIQEVLSAVAKEHGKPGDLL